MRKTLEEEWEGRRKAVKNFKDEVKKVVIGDRSIEWFLFRISVIMVIVGVLMLVIEICDI